MIYLDTSFLAPFYIQEATSTSVETILLNIPTEQLAISDWTIVEFTSLVSRRVRMSELNLEQMEAVINSFKEDVAQSYTVFTVTSADFILAAEFIQQWETGLRAGDALHLAIARNHSIENLLSLDRGLIDAARQLSIPLDSSGLL
ncbi:MAG: type II toxin-antitoxin system VapC family toxin [Methylacidiphilales bacterium]|nr:type II toxin-antitoxin system VapC family toxin [Candidatus Methylacidiphilales bacterium]NJR17573.1 type II toxin-antitoxin system VapC family toxin [Calothrix sp. CSU_2_0]